MFKSQNGGGTEIVVITATLLLALLSGCVLGPSSGVDQGCPNDGWLRVEVVNSAPENVSPQTISAHPESAILRNALERAVASQEATAHNLTSKQTAAIEGDLSTADRYVGPEGSGWYVRHERTTLRVKLYCEG